MPRDSERAILCSQIDTLLEDPTFRQRLRTLIEDHYSLLQKQQHQHQFYLRLLLSPLDDEYVVLLLTARDKNNPTYSPTQFVPYRYEELERNGLVHCSHGPTDDAGLGPRTITLTQKGQEIAEHHARIRSAYQTQQAFQALIEKTRQFPRPS